MHLECALGAGPGDVVQSAPQQAGFPAGCGVGYGVAPPAAMGKFERQNSGKSRKKTYLCVARVAASVVSAVTGVPLDFF